MCLKSCRFPFRPALPPQAARPPFPRFWAILLLVIFKLAWCPAQPVTIINGDNTRDTWASGLAPYNVNGLGVVGLVPYHPQVTGYFCGPATMEMTLDCNAVRNNNAVIDYMLGGGTPGANPGAPAVDGPSTYIFPRNQNWTRPNYQVVNLGNGPVGVATYGVQSYMYGLIHGLYTYNSHTYYNLYAPPGTGTFLDQVTAGLNLMDGPANNAGIHNYVGYNVTAYSNPAYTNLNILNRDYANRTMAYCLLTYGIPAAALVENGQHWFCVVGVRTTKPPVLNGDYKILGFYIHDPWSGFFQANAPALLAAVKAAGKDAKGIEGLGENRYMTYAVNQGRAVGEWIDLFNISGGPPLPVYGSGLGYKFAVEPVGPAPLDNGNNGEYNSIPAPSPVLPDAPIASAEALVYATNALAADTFMSSQPGFNDGGWDVANASLVQYPTDTVGEGDWLIPYEGSGGTNDVTGFVLIDIQTGNLDESVWMNPGDTVPSLTLDEVDAMETDEFAGEYVDDNDAGNPELSINQLDPNDVVLNWAASPLYSYTLQQNTNLLTTNWVTVTNLVATEESISQVIVPTSATQQQFFRLYSTNSP
jgi:hypothetical protein